jgi:magnesium transporter
VLTVLIRAEHDRFVQAEASELRRMLDTPGVLVWVDLESPDPSEVAVLSDVFQFHPLTIDDCLNYRVDPPKADDYGDYLFLVTQGIDFSAQSNMVATTELNIYLGPSYVVSFHHRPLAAVEETRDRCSRGTSLPTRGADWLAHALLDALVDHVLPVVEAMDEEIAALEDEALGRPDTGLIERMTTLKRSTLRLRRLVAPQRDMVNRMSRGDFAHLVRDETHMYYRDIYDHLVRLEDMIEALRDLGDSVIATYLATVNNRMSEIMKALSLVGTIFLPLTLLASVFGTNFAPTYEDWGWTGFLIMCTFMVVCIAGLTWWFRRRQWL